MAAVFSRVKEDRKREVAWKDGKKVVAKDHVRHFHKDLLNGDERIHWLNLDPHNLLPQPKTKIHLPSTRSQTRGSPKLDYVNGCKSLAISTAVSSPCPLIDRFVSDQIRC